MENPLHEYEQVKRGANPCCVGESGNIGRKRPPEGPLSSEPGICRVHVRRLAEEPRLLANDVHKRDEALHGQPHPVGVEVSLFIAGSLSG